MSRMRPPKERFFAGDIYAYSMGIHVCGGAGIGSVTWSWFAAQSSSGREQHLWEIDSVFVSHDTQLIVANG